MIVLMPALYLFEWQFQSRRNLLNSVDMSVQTLVSGYVKKMSKWRIRIKGLNEMKVGDKIKIWGSMDYETLMYRFGSIKGIVIKFVNDFKSPDPTVTEVPVAIVKLDNIIEHQGNKIKYIAMHLVYEGVTWEGEYEPGQQTIGFYSVPRIPDKSLDEFSREEVVGLECRSVFEII